MASRFTLLLSPSPSPFSASSLLPQFHLRHNLSSFLNLQERRWWNSTVGAKHSSLELREGCPKREPYPYLPGHGFASPTTATAQPRELQKRNSQFVVRGSSTSVSAASEAGQAEHSQTLESFFDDTGEFFEAKKEPLDWIKKFVAAGLVEKGLNFRHFKKTQEVDQRRAGPLHTTSAVFSSKSSAAPAVYVKDARLNNEYLDSKEERHQSLDDETIAAIVTAMGGQDGAVAIVRLSGTSAVEIVGRLFQPARRARHERTSHTNREWTPESHRVQYGNLVDSSGSLVDEVLVVPMLAPRSYTREDVVELQCHGGDLCVRRVLQLCLEAGARLAQPGEFTLRAFLNGRLDLAQAESVSQLVAAKTSAAAQSALAGIQGGLSSFVQALRLECIDLLVEIEARLDFDDEMPSLDTSALVTRIETMCQRLQQALSTAGRGRLLQSGLQVAIVGRPNVGKSSLLNAWSQSERAIVTDVPGTTRDIVEARMVVGGIAVNLLDTAGIRDTVDVVEKIGVERSEAVAKAADVVVMVISASDGWTSADAIIFERIWGTEGILRQRKEQSGGVLSGPMAPATEVASVTNDDETVQVPSLLVVNKVDKAAAGSVVLPLDVQNAFYRRVATCATQGVGLQELDMAILDLVGLGHVSSEGQQWAVNQRQSEQLVRANEALQRVVESVQMEIPLDMWTIDLKEAAIALGEISGDDVSEEVLSNIFNRFCIGK